MVQRVVHVRRARGNEIRMLQEEIAPPTLREDERKSASHRSQLQALRLLGGTRLLVLVAVFGLFLAAATLLVYGNLLALKTVWDTVNTRDLNIEGLDHLIVLLVELTDAFLLGCVLIIVALGLYQLFINADMPLPPWLRVTTLDALKAKLMGAVVMLLGVSFVGVVVESEGTDLLRLGLSIAVVIAALSLFLKVTHVKDSDE